MANFEKNFDSFDSSKIPKYKVELHVHLEGSIRLQTIWELCQKKNHHITESFEDLTNACVIREPTDLTTFLKPIRKYLPLVAGDPDVIQRVAYEFCEDAAQQKILYAELRYSPHLLSSTNGEALGSNPLTPREAVVAVLAGLEKGNRDFRIKVRSILCTIRGRKGWTSEVVKLCDEFRDRGVVGMDIAGDHQSTDEGEIAEDSEGFQLAESLGIHRTAHAAENAPASQVRLVRRHLRAERIGHGYRVVTDPDIYAECLRDGVHFETCPYSSMLTGAVDPRLHRKHPIVRFIEDGASFSISRDDTTMTAKTLDEDYDFLRQMGVKEFHFVQANFNAANSSFLPPKEKMELIEDLKRIYGTDDK